MRMLLWVSLLLALSCWRSRVQAHPQCLSFVPPFNVTLKFCSRYSGFGCCTEEEDAQLQTRFRQLSSDVASATWGDCSQDIKEVMCMRCSPYAAHLFDAEVRNKARDFPGFCKEQCLSFHRRCNSVVSLIAPDTRNYDDAETFCDETVLVDMDYCFPDLLTNPLFNNNLENVQRSQPGCLCLEELDSSLHYALAAVNAGDGSNRLFLVEQSGRIYVFRLSDNRRLSRPFLDIRSAVANSDIQWDERGLLGLAFHPNYRSNGRFFVYYVTPREPSAVSKSFWKEKEQDKVRVSEFRVSRDDPNVADPASEKILLEIEQPYWNHNGGEILFGDDGFLYLFVGDGGDGGDPHNFAQNKSVLLGKVLRVDVDRRGEGGRAYAIPPDNPFLHESGTHPEIFAFGIRNIWRCGKDSGDRSTGEGKGRIICGDVGQSAFEELDLLKKGANYGWRSREGDTCFEKSECGKVGREERPIHVYSHSVGKSITGGHFYRGCRFPSLDGYYIYGDYMSARLFKLRLTREGQWENTEVFMCGSCPRGTTGKFKRFIYSFGEDEHGEMYMLGTELGPPPSSSLYRIVDPSRCRDKYRDGRLRRKRRHSWNRMQNRRGWRMTRMKQRRKAGLKRTGGKAKRGRNKPVKRRKARNRHRNKERPSRTRYPNKSGRKSHPRGNARSRRKKGSRNRASKRWRQAGSRALRRRNRFRSQWQESQSPERSRSWRRKSWSGARNVARRKERIQLRRGPPYTWRSRHKKRRGRHGRKWSRKMRRKGSSYRRRQKYSRRGRGQVDGRSRWLERSQDKWRRYEDKSPKSYSPSRRGQYQPCTC